MAEKSIFPKELVTRLILCQAPLEDIDIEKYRVFSMGHVIDNVKNADHWQVPSKYSKEHFLTVIVSKNSAGVIQLAFSET